MRLWRGVLFAVVMYALIGLVLMLAFGEKPSWAAEVRREYLRVTYYTLHGRMADGAMVHKDAAACSQWLPFGTQLMFEDGYIVTCEDRGLGDYFWKGWTDVWAPSSEWGRENVEASYGTYAWVSVIRWGWDE